MGVTETQGFEELRPGDCALWLFKSSDEVDAGLRALDKSAHRRSARVLLCLSAEMTASEFGESRNRLRSERLTLPAVLENGEFAPAAFIAALREKTASVVEPLTVVIPLTFLQQCSEPFPACLALVKALLPLLRQQQLILLFALDKDCLDAARTLAVVSLFPHLLFNGALIDNFRLDCGENVTEQEAVDQLFENFVRLLPLRREENGFDWESFGSNRYPIKLQEIIDSMGDGVLVSDDQGAMLVFNKAAQSIFGFELTHLHLPLAERARKLGNFLPDMVTPYPIEELPIAKALRGEQADQVEIYVKNERRPQGAFISSTARPMYAPDGSVKGTVLVFRDITAQKKAVEENLRLEARVYQAQKLEGLGLLAGGIAHDFNNLLMGVLGNAGLALLELPPGTDVHSRVEQIKVGAQRLAELTNQLLAYSGKASFTEEVIDISDLMNEMLGLLKTVVSKKAVLEADFAAELPLIRADVTQLRQIVMNLITNASDALGDRQGRIVVRTGDIRADRPYLLQTILGDKLAEGDYVYVEVSDEGCGMDEETQRRIFDPFFTTKVKGRGLGLAAVLGLMRRHGGTLKVDSEAGKGTVMRVLFPAIAGKKAVVAPRDVKQQVFRGRGTVLIIDDEELVRDITKEMLEYAGFNVLLAATGKEGLSVYEEHADEVAVVILDMTMPDLSGEEVFRALREYRPGVKILFSSGYSKDKRVEALLEEGSVGYLQKPYVPQVLLARITELL